VGGARVERITIVAGEQAPQSQARRERRQLRGSWVAVEEPCCGSRPHVLQATQLCPLRVVEGETQGPSWPSMSSITPLDSCVRVRPGWRSHWASPGHTAATVAIPPQSCVGVSRDAAHCSQTVVRSRERRDPHALYRRTDVLPSSPIRDLTLPTAIPRKVQSSEKRYSVGVGSDGRNGNKLGASLAMNVQCNRGLTATNREPAKR
jgi:hypothetical protein